MKILLVAEWIKIPGLEGGAVHHSNYAKALANLGHEVHILCNCEEGFLDGNKNIFLHSSPKISFRPKLSKASMPIIEKLIKEYKIDVVHKRLDPGSGYAIEVAHKLGVPVVAEINYNPFAFERTGSFYNDFIKPKLQSYLRHRWAKKVYEQADAVMCVSHSIEKTIKRHNINPKILGTIHNGVNVEKFNPKNKVNLKNLNLNPNKPIVSLIGSLGPRHGLKQVIESAAYLPDVDFLIIGGIKKYEKFVSEMKKIAPENVKFVGAVDYSKIQDFISASTICLAPYEESLNSNEPFGFCPIKILEYMAAGKPVVASDLEWIAELIQNKEEGLLINLNNKSELVEAIKLLLTNKKLTSYISKKARKKAEELSWKNAAKRYERIYKRILNSN